MIGIDIVNVIVWCSFYLRKRVRDCKYNRVLLPVLVCVCVCVCVCIYIYMFVCVCVCVCVLSFMPVLVWL